MNSIPKITALIITSEITARWGADNTDKLDTESIRMSLRPGWTTDMIIGKYLEMVEQDCYASFLLKNLISSDNQEFIYEAGGRYIGAFDPENGDTWVDFDIKLNISPVVSL